MKINAGKLAMVVALGVLSVPVSARSVYVKVPDAPLREGDSLGGPSIALLQVGTELTVLKEDRFRMQVRTPSGKQGYVATRQVQDAPPDKGQGVGGLVREDRAVGERRTAAVGLGLTDSAVKMAEQKELDPVLVEMVREMEGFYQSISEQSVDSFLKEGGLNP